MYETTRGETWDWVLSCCLSCDPLPSTLPHLCWIHGESAPGLKSSFSPAATPTWPDFLFILSLEAGFGSAAVPLAGKSQRATPGAGLGNRPQVCPPPSPVFCSCLLCPSSLGLLLPRLPLSSRKPCPAFNFARQTEKLRRQKARRIHCPRTLDP